MVERFQMKHEHGWICARPDDKGDWVRHSDYEALERQLAEARAEYLTASKDAMELAGKLNAAEAERDRLAANNARLVKASTYFVDRLKDAWLGKIIRDMDEAEAAFIAALAGKE